MDLDSFFKEFRAFKARVEPLLKDYESHKSKQDGPGIDPHLSQIIHAPLHKPGEEPTLRSPDPEPDWDAINAPLHQPGEGSDLIDGIDPKNGPTLKQWLASGMKAATYPPKPYQMRGTTQQELDAAVAAEKTA